MENRKIAVLIWPGDQKPTLQQIYLEVNPGRMGYSLEFVEPPQEKIFEKLLKGASSKYAQVIVTPGMPERLITADSVKVIGRKGFSSILRRDSDGPFEMIEELVSGKELSVKGAVFVYLELMYHAAVDLLALAGRVDICVNYKADNPAGFEVYGKLGRAEIHRQASSWIASVDHETVGEILDTTQMKRFIHMYTA